MDKLLAKEIDFVLEPTYTKINKTVNVIIKELVNIVGKQYSSIINERISRTNFVFFNKNSDLKKYFEKYSKDIKKLKDKKISEKYENLNKVIHTYETKVTKVVTKISSDFILEIKDDLSDEDQNYIKSHKKIDLTKLNCYKLFFETKDSNLLLDGLFMCFSDEYEKKLKDKSTTINEMEEIFNNREKCLKLLGVKNINIKTFDRNSLIHIFDSINKYNKQYRKELENLNLNKEEIIENFLLTEKLLNDTKNVKVSKYFNKLLKKNKTEINKINDRIINKIAILKEPDIIWASDNYSDDNNMRFLLFSPTMDFENNDFLFVRGICRLAFNSENFNNKAVVQDNSIIGKDKYLMFGNLIIDLIAYQITKKITENKTYIINSNVNNNMVNFEDGLFLVDKFYTNYNNSINQSLINNDNTYIYEQIGKANFENYINIINKYFYDCHGNLLPITERKKAVFTRTIENILKISLANMEQYKKILINKNKYSTNE